MVHSLTLLSLTRSASLSVNYSISQSVSHCVILESIDTSLTITIQCTNTISVSVDLVHSLTLLSLTRSVSHSLVALSVR